MIFVDRLLSSRRKLALAAHQLKTSIVADCRTSLLGENIAKNKYFAVILKDIVIKS